MAPAGSTSVLAMVREEDRPAVRRSASAAGLGLVVVASVNELLAELRRKDWAATVVSLSVPPMDGQLARRIADERSAGPLVLTAGEITVERAFATERAGAVALLQEPLDETDLAARLSTLLEEEPEIPLPDPRSVAAEDGEILPIGESPAMAHVFETVARVADSDATVLLTGESGTGKEIVARTLHRSSRRRSRAFVAVNCAAIPEHLLESELFGHERGAFTGAVARRVGRFERADGGTLFLDEIGDMSLVLQAKVLRALEERTVERVGGAGEHAVDVRVIAATNQDLASATREGRFREDLFFRLAVVELHLPPLRERGRDVRTLALHFAARFAERHARPIRAITVRALGELEDAAWPGNVRELRNVMDRAVLLARGSTIRASDLRIGAAAPRSSARPSAQLPQGYPATLSLREVEADHIRRVLASVDGHLGKAAESLGIHRNTLANKIKDHGIDVGSRAGHDR